jgi:hypothetical protein
VLFLDLLKSLAWGSIQAEIKTNSKGTFMLFLSFFLFAAEISQPQDIKGRWNAWLQKEPPVVSLTSKSASDGKTQAENFAAELAKKHNFVEYKGVADIKRIYKIIGSCDTDESGFNGIFRIQDAKNAQNKYTAIVRDAQTQEAFENFLLTLLDTYNKRETIFKSKDTEVGGSSPQNVDNTTPQRPTRSEEESKGGSASMTRTVNVEEAIDAALNAEKLVDVQGWTFADFSNAISLLGKKSSEQKGYSKLKDHFISNFFNLFVSSGYEVGVSSKSSLVLSPSPVKSENAEKSPFPQPVGERQTDDSQISSTSIDIGTWNLDSLEFAASYIRDKKYDSNEECKKFMKILNERIITLKIPSAAEGQRTHIPPHSGEATSQSPWEAALNSSTRFLQGMANSPEKVLAAVVTTVGIIVWFKKPKV